MTRINISITLDPSLAEFIKHYQEQHQISSRSEVIEQAIKALRQQQLVEEYKQSIQQWESDPEEARLWDATVGDGIEPEVWD